MTASLRCELFPADLDAAIGFYVDVLGFTLDRDERASCSPYVALTHGTVRLGLAQRDDVGGAESRRPPAGVELVLEVDDLTAARDRVTTAGWSVDEDLTERSWGLVDFRVLDPAGYYWRITSRASG
ncbi:VOC family protein [Jannaschia sp. R86511]|uniref:VOC family protein n=1 Tax=Jannaschia sp. R86511 TaxID=3093853 RepID=UPI0036D34411